MSTYASRHIIDYLEIWSLRQNNTGFLQSCGRVSITVWMHNIYASEMNKEKARWKLLKIATFCFEQILEATLHKTTDVRLFTSNLIEVSRTRRPGLLEKQVRSYGASSYRHLHMYAPVWLTRKD